MTKPSNFIANTDYSTLKNDNKGTVTLYIGDSGVLPYGSSKVYESFITLGTINAGIRCQMKTDAVSGIWASSSILAPVTVTVDDGSTFSYDMPVVIDRVSATSLRLHATFYSYGSGVSMQITGGYQTITCDVVTFLSPFN